MKLEIRALTKACGTLEVLCGVDEDADASEPGEATLLVSLYAFPPAENPS